MNQLYFIQKGWKMFVGFGKLKYMHYLKKEVSILWLGMKSYFREVKIKDRKWRLLFGKIQVRKEKEKKMNNNSWDPRVKGHFIRMGEIWTPLEAHGKKSLEKWVWNFQDWGLEKWNKVQQNGEVMEPKGSMNGQIFRL